MSKYHTYPLIYITHIAFHSTVRYTEEVQHIEVHWVQHVRLFFSTWSIWLLCTWSKLNFHKPDWNEIFRCWTRRWIDDWLILVIPVLWLVVNDVMGKKCCISRGFRRRSTRLKAISSETSSDSNINLVFLSKCFYKPLKRATCMT